jgi:hypothetical protein
MKRLLIIGLVALAGAAHAAPPPPPAWATLAAREARTGARIETAARARQISAAEADRLRLKLRRTESLRAYYRRSHGLSAWERRDIERRLKTLDARLAKEIRAARR